MAKHGEPSSDRFVSIQKIIPERTDGEKESEGNVRFLYIITVITVDDLCIRKSWGKYRLRVITHACTHARTDRNALTVDN
jgi:hypothetical protein